MADFLTDNLPTLLNAGVDILLGLIDGIISALPELIPAAAEMMVQLAAGLVEAIPKLLERLPEIISAIWDGLTNVDWGELGTTLLNSILSGLGGNWRKPDRAIHRGP